MIVHYSEVFGRLAVKIGQRTHKWRSSSPYLSGDFFASQCDLTINANFTESKNLLTVLNTASVIFCKGDLVLDFIGQFGDFLSGKVLLVGNSDKDWHNFPISECPGIKGVFLQNSFLTDERIYTLPIGIENISYYRNGRPQNFGDNFVNRLKNDDVLVGPFSPTHAIRSEILESVMDSSRVSVYGYKQIEPLAYATMSSKFGYIASPRGNGEDTHRLWESLYRGSSPVILRNNWAESLNNLKLPIHLIDYWNQSSLEELPKFETFSPIDLEPLWWPYWKKKINELL